MLLFVNTYAKFERTISAEDAEDGGEEREETGHHVATEEEPHEERSRRVPASKRCVHILRVILIASRGRSESENDVNTVVAAAEVADHGAARGEAEADGVALCVHVESSHKEDEQATRHDSHDESPAEEDDEKDLSNETQPDLNNKKISFELFIGYVITCLLTI